MVVVARPYLHAKAIVVDQKAIYLGSENFTKNSLDHNRELGLVTTNVNAVSTVSTTVSADIAGEPSSDSAQYTGGGNGAQRAPHALRR